MLAEHITRTVYKWYYFNTQKNLVELQSSVLQLRYLPLFLLMAQALVNFNNFNTHTHTRAVAHLNAMFSAFSTIITERPNLLPNTITLNQNPNPYQIV